MRFCDQRGDLTPLTQTTSPYFSKRQKEKKPQMPVILYQQHLKNPFFSGLRARARRTLSLYWNSNKHFCHPLEVARFFKKGVLGSPLENRVTEGQTV